MIYVTVGLVCSLFATAILMRFMPAIPMYNRLTSQANLDAGTGIDHPVSELLGKTAMSASPLAPSGKIVIDGKQYDAIAQSGYIDADTELKVIEADGMRIVVEKV